MPTANTSGAPSEWVLLAYRMPREPSTPRIAVWRKLKSLGVAQLGDGLVALPADARTREALEWVAQQVTEADGTASIWLAQPGSRRQHDDLATQLAAARRAEYAAIIAQARDALRHDETTRLAALRRLRAELKRIGRRDYFSPSERDKATAAVAALSTAAIVKEQV